MKSTESAPINNKPEEQAYSETPYNEKLDSHNSKKLGKTAMQETRTTQEKNEHISKGELKEATQALDGWYTVRSISKKIGLNTTTINRILNNHPEIQSREYKTANGVFSHYNLEEAKNIPEIKEFLDAEPAPEGWYTIGGLKRIMNLDYYTIKSILDNHSEIQPKEYRTSRGLLSFYNSVEVQNLPEIKRLLSTELAPEGWYTTRRLAEEIGLSYGKVEKTLNIHPDIPSKNYKTSTGRILPHYALEEVSNLSEIKELSEAARSPKGWYTINGLEEKINLTSKTIKKILNDHPEIQPEEYRANNKIRHYYNLEEIQKLPEVKRLFNMLKQDPSKTKELQNTKPAPEGWYTIKGLAKEIGLITKTIKTLLNSHPEIQSKEYKINNGVFPYYNLEEVKNLPEIKEFLDAEPAPEGWYTIGGLAKKMNLDGQTIKKILNNYPEVQPKEFRPHHKVSTYYFLEEVKNLPEIKEFLDVGLAPKEWYTIGGLARKIGFSHMMIKKIINNHPEVQTKKCWSHKGVLPCYYLEEIENLPEIKEFLDAESAPEGWYTISGLARIIDANYQTIKKILNNHPEIQPKEYKTKNGIFPHYYLEEAEDAVLEYLERTNAGTSIAERILAFYIIEAVGQNNVKQNQRPEWLRHPVTNHKREIDILIGPPPEPGIGIEYDGGLWHKDAKRDMDKNRLAKERKGIDIIHIRERGCPKLTDGSICIYRKDWTEKTLEESIKTCLLTIQEKYPTLSIQIPDINIARDNAKIYESMCKEMSANIDSVSEDSFNQLSVVPT